MPALHHEQRRYGFCAKEGENMPQINSIVFQNWRIVREIGSGSFGCVYELQREDFGEIYRSALKVITVPHSQSEIQSLADEGMSPADIERYLYGSVTELVREFAIMARLKATGNVVSYEDHLVVKHENAIGWDILIRMELLTPLVKYAELHPMTCRDVIRLGIDICKALELCQKYNIIHRDIKPDNIFATDDGTFKLGDFGIARTIEETSMFGLSKKGTYNYMAPEVYNGGSYGFSVDTYSLGIVLYRLLNQNRIPFLPMPPEKITASARERALTLRMSGAELPPPCFGVGRLGEIVLKACAFDPEKRYRTPTQMRQELEAILYNSDDASLIYPKGDVLVLPKNVYISSQSSNEGKAPPLAARGRGDAPQGAVNVEARRRKRRVWPGVFLGALLTVVMCGAITAVFLHRSRSNAQAAQYAQYMEQAQQCRDSDPGQALELYRSARALYPQEEATCIAYAYTLYSACRYDDCAAYIENDLALGKRFSQTGQNQLSELLGAAYFEQGDYAAAASFFRMSAAGASIAVDAMRDYAVSLGRLGDVQAANEIMSKMKNAGASGSVMTYVQAEINYALGSFQLAEEGFQSALETAQDPTVRRRCVHSLAELYRDCISRGDGSPIANPAQREIDILNWGIQTLNLQYDTVLYEMLGMAYYQAYQADSAGHKDYLSGAASSFRRVIDLGLRQDYLYRNLYTVYYEQQDYDEASRCLEEYAAAFPHDYMPHALRAILIIAQENQKPEDQRDYSAALSEYQTAGSMLRSSDDQTYYAQAGGLIDQLRVNGWL